MKLQIRQLNRDEVDALLSSKKATRAYRVRTTTSPTEKDGLNRTKTTKTSTSPTVNVQSEWTKTSTSPIFSKNKGSPLAQQNMILHFYATTMPIWRYLLNLTKTLKNKTKKCEKKFSSFEGWRHGSEGDRGMQNQVLASRLLKNTASRMYMYRDEVAHLPYCHQNLCAVHGIYPPRARGKYLNSLNRPISDHT